MQRIKIMTDSASDISKKQAEEYGIKVIGFHIIVGDNSYLEGVDIETRKFYDILETSDELPHTSQVTLDEYVKAYKELYIEGYSDIINVTISSTGSNSYNNAIMAIEEFYDECPEAKDKISVTVLDSKGYTGVYGFPVIEAAKKLKKGETKENLVAFLNDWFASGVIVCTAYTLKYARKSGRVGCATAFVGEVLGIKPIITFIDAVSETVDKVRGSKLVIPKLAEIALTKMVPQTPYAILFGKNKEYADEIANIMKNQTGYEPTEYLEVGATISCHLGCDVAGVIIKGQKRR